MFFIIAITSSMAFTFIGTSFIFWSNTLNNIEKRYPYDFTYTTFGKEAKVEEEISFLETILKEEKYYYKKAIIKTSIYTSKDTTTFSIINESTYKQLANQLNVDPMPIKENNAIEIVSSEGREIDSIEIDGRLLTVSKEVKSNMLPEPLDNVYVVKDQIFDAIVNKEETTDIYTFKVKDWTNSYKVYDRYAEKYGSDQYSLLLSKSHIYETEKRAYGVVMFLSIFIGVIFFVASSSFIYNKFYMEEEADKTKYNQLNKIGLTYNEIKKVVTLEIGTLFLLPYIVAVVHSSFAMTALKNLYKMNITKSAFLVMGSFLLVQILYFLFIRGKYLSEMREQLVD